MYHIIIKKINFQKELSKILEDTNRQKAKHGGCTVDLSSVEVKAGRSEGHPCLNCDVEGSQGSRSPCLNEQSSTTENKKLLKSKWVKGMTRNGCHFHFLTLQWYLQWSLEFGMGQEGFMGQSLRKTVNEASFCPVWHTLCLPILVLQVSSFSTKVDAWCSWDQLLQRDAGSVCLYRWTSIAQLLHTRPPL